MKQPRKVYLYNSIEGKFIKEYPSIKACSFETGILPNVIGNIMNGKQYVTSNGLHFSPKQLTPEEIDKLPFPTEKKEKKKEKELVEIKNPFHNEYSYEVGCYDQTACFIPNGRKERVEFLKKFIAKRLHERWMTIPKRQAALEEQFLLEITNSLL